MKRDNTHVYFLWHNEIHVFNRGCLFYKSETKSTVDVYWNDLKTQRLFVLFQLKYLFYDNMYSVFSSVVTLNQYQWFEWKSKSALAFQERGVTLYYQIRWFCIHKRTGFPGCFSGKVHYIQINFMEYFFHVLMFNLHNVQQNSPDKNHFIKILNLCTKTRRMQDG